MANKHVKVINGRKYYYESIRVGKKVTSRYLGPVERIRKKKNTYMGLDEQMLQQPEQAAEEQSNSNAEDGPEDNYIG